MARLDALCLLSDAQAFTVTAVSTNTYDCGNITPKRQVGDGRPICICVQIDVTAVFTTGDETYSFEAVQSSAAALTTPTILAREAYIASGALISTLLVAGYVIVLPIPYGMPIQRFIGLNVTTGGNADRAVTLTSWVSRLEDAPIKPVLYPKAYTITG